ncbi:MAG: hypothetical protein LBD41_01600 [Clostridiales Family XIII bacterium]|jgi:hypothetical protein|nr:hypothetical protein [Clostridiales Family XIII bacterium]
MEYENTELGLKEFICDFANNVNDDITELNNFSLDEFNYKDFSEGDVDDLLEMLEVKEERKRKDKKNGR